jgi:hypothetical protein
MSIKNEHKSQLPIVIIIVVILILCICCAGGSALSWISFNDVRSKWESVVSPVLSSSSDESTSSESSSLSNNSNDSYPSLYTDANLPEYENATVIKTNEKTDLFYNEVTVTLESSDSIETIGAYFEKEFEALDWEFETTDFTYEYIYFNQFQKEEQYFNLSITKNSEDENSVIDISYIRY